MCNEIDCKKSLVYSLRAKMRGHDCLVQLQLCVPENVYKSTTSIDPGITNK